MNHASVPANSNLYPSITDDAAGATATIQNANPQSWLRLEPAWHTLAGSAGATTFQRSDWVGTWLDHFGFRLGTRFWTLREQSQLSGACLLTTRREWRGPVPIKVVYLNTDGEDSGAGVCAEFNQVLCIPGSEARIVESLKQSIHKSGVNEFVCRGLTSKALDHLRGAFGDWDSDITICEDPYVDLEGLRRSGENYRQAALSTNSRRQAKQTLKAYAGLGEVRTEVAGSVERALEMLGELAVLHQATWSQRGERGKFASTQFRSFHEALIRRTFDRSTVLLLRVTAGDELIGLTYNFVDNGSVYFYQSGLHYRSDNHYRPGIATHISAIEHCLEIGLSQYHFLAGSKITPRYKQSLSTHSRPLAWATFKRRGIRNRLIAQMRALKGSPAAQRLARLGAQVPVRSMR